MTILLVFLFLIGYFTSGIVACGIAWNLQLKKEEIDKTTDLMVLMVALGYFSLLGIGSLVFFKFLVRCLNDLDQEKFYEVLKRLRNRIKVQK